MKFGRSTTARLQPCQSQIGTLFEPRSLTNAVHNAKDVENFPTPVLF
jgi:hypothetical protein